MCIKILFFKEVICAYFEEKCLTRKKKTAVWHHYNDINEGKHRISTCKYCVQTCK